MSSILVTGATGTVGHEVASVLRQRDATFRTSTRHPEAVNERKVYLDFRQPASFSAALEGVERIFLVRPSDVVDVEESFVPFVRAAREQGVKQITFLSVMGAEYQPMIPHARIERAIMDVQIAYSFLRPSFFMQNLITSHLNEIRRDNTLYIPAGHSKTSLIDARDIAEAGANCLLAEQYWNTGYTLTGADALSYDEVAQAMTEELGRPITYAHPTPAQFKEHMLAQGVPAAFVQVMIEVYHIAELGLVAAVSPELATLLGRPPRSIRDFVHDYREQF